MALGRMPAVPTPHQRGQGWGQVRTEAQGREAIYLGLPAENGRGPDPAQSARATFYGLVSANEKSAAAQARAGEELEDPLRPPTEGGASAEVSMTQSYSDEIPGSAAKGMAWPLGSCRLRTQQAALTWPHPLAAS